MPSKPTRIQPLGMITITSSSIDPVSAIRNRPDLVKIREVRMSKESPPIFPPTTNALAFAEWLDAKAIEIISATRAGEGKTPGRWNGRWNLIIGASQETIANLAPNASHRPN